MRIRSNVLIAAFLVIATHEAVAQRTKVPTATLNAEPCDFEIAKEYGDRVSCHRLIVPRDYADPSQGTFGLAVVRVRAERPAAGRAPLLLLHGGPGGRGITFTMGRVRPAFAPGSDLIAFDQRGNGRSDPRICGDIPSELRSAIAAPGDLLTTAWRMNEPYMRCRTQFEKAGVRPEHFGTRITSEDAEQLRRALGIDRWNLLAISYGTVVALDLMAAYPKSIGRVVLDSVVGHTTAMDRSEYDRPLREVFSRCEADEACSRDYPSLAADYETAVTSFNERPIVVKTKEGSTLPLDLDLNGGDFQFLARRMMRSTKNIASIPLLVQAAKARDVETLRPLLAEALGALPEPNMLGRSAILCREVPAYRSVAAPTHGVEAFRLLGVCGAWGPLGPPVRIARNAKSPVLILMGELDPLYEPAFVRHVKSELGPKARVLLFPNRTHGIWSPGCAQEMVSGFFESGTVPEIACASTDAKIAFTPPPKEADRASSEAASRDPRLR